MLDEKLSQDLKSALLNHDQLGLATIRSIKSALLYEQVAKGGKDVPLSREDTLAVLQKEAKKRQESADIYLKAGDNTRAEQELKEKAIIEGYLPPKLTEEQIIGLIEQAIQDAGGLEQAKLGEIIGKVKQLSAGAADGATVALLVKQKFAA